MTELQWSRPAAGREPAAAALLAWLADADAPRLCVVTGSAGSGKSALLAWLIAHGTREGCSGSAGCTVSCRSPARPR
ncbi:hypothetical protein O1M54_21845 [Streptomyces diastatochromogenes]|nr:hypothetical protein [Streptomyces diastatochromogenes]